MTAHKKNLKRHPALVGGPNRDLHEVVVVTDVDTLRKSVFIDGREIVMPEGADIEAHWSDEDLPRITITAYAETIEVISWDEMERRSY